MMQVGGGGLVKSEADVEMSVASTSAAMDGDVPPPKKRIKSGQTSRDASAEPGPIDQSVGENGCSSCAQLLQDAVETKPSLGMLKLSIARKGGLEASEVTLESATASSPTLAATETPVSPYENETLQTSAAKKKKTSSSNTSTKKEASLSNTSTKTKKSSTFAKKASSSASPLTHQETGSTSRTKAKVEIVSPPAIAVKIADEEDEEEDNALYCICQRRQDEVEGGMIMCDRCEQWYHYRCIEITEDDAELVDQFICPPCHEVTGEKTTCKEACKRGGCRRAAMIPFSRFCSDRCGVLAVTGKMATLKLEKNKAAAAAFEAKRKVIFARKTEALTERTENYDSEWKRICTEDMSGSIVGAGSGARLGLAGIFAMLVKGDSEAASTPTIMVSNCVTEPLVNGTSTKPSPPPSPPADESHRSASTLSSTEASSAASLISIAEQMAMVTNQIFAVDLEKSRLNARLDRLDLRSTLLHLVSDRVPTLPPVGSSSATQPSETTDGAEDDEDMPDDPAPKKTTKKKKGGAKSKSKASADVSGGPRCGYDQRLHWDDSEFDIWAQAEPGRSILSYESTLDGALEDSTDGVDQGGRVVCGLAKRKCRRHLDWSNLCELALDAEKASLNADSRVLTQLKLGLVETVQRLREEKEAVMELVEEHEKREKRRREEGDREIAFQVANQGTRRET